MYPMHDTFVSEIGRQRHEADLERARQRRLRRGGPTRLRRSREPAPAAVPRSLPSGLAQLAAR